MTRRIHLSTNERADLIDDEWMDDEWMDDEWMDDEWMESESAAVRFWKREAEMNKRMGYIYLAAGLVFGFIAGLIV